LPKEAEKKPAEPANGKRGPPLKRTNRLENVKNRVQKIQQSDITSIESLQIKDITTEDTGRPRALTRL
jgi:hypothetical protein